MIISNVIHRVFRIRYKNTLGTAFTIDVNGLEFLITAKHIVANLKGTDRIGILRNNSEWHYIDMQLLGHCQGADIQTLVRTPRVRRAKDARAWEDTWRYWGGERLNLSFSKTNKPE